MELNSYLLKERLPTITLGANAVVGTAAATVDIVSNLGVTASAASLVFTLPNPTDTRSGRSVSVMNTGTNGFVMYGQSIKAGQYGQFMWGAEDSAWHSLSVPQESGADFWRSGSLAGAMPDGTTDVQDAIFRSGQTVVDTGANGDSGLTLDDLRSRNSVQLTSGDAGVTDTNMTAIGVDLNGKVRLSNSLSIPDLRATNPAPQDYAAGFSNVFKQTSAIDLTPATVGGSVATYANLQTTRRYANGTDFSGGQVRQDVDLEDGRQFFRLSTGATTWGPWTLESALASNFNLQDLLSLNAHAHVSKTGEVSWDNRFITMTAGTTAQEPSGYHDIGMPAVGTLIQHANGTTVAVVAATAGDSLATGGIPLAAWETLWYRMERGTGNSTDPTKFRIVYYPNSVGGTGGLLGSGVNPEGDASEWVRVVSRDDQNHFRWGTGDTVGMGGRIGTDAVMTSNFYSALKQRVMGSGYFFSPGGNTTTPLAFGFTGTIRWIDGGAQGYTANSGYVDVSNRTVGQVVYGWGGAPNRAWRLMTAVEKPAWFGGATRGNDPILAASTTVVDLADNEILCWVPAPALTTAGSWYVFNYTGNNSVLPVHALPVASRQVTGGHGTIQVLLGGVQYALKAGDARYTSTNDATMDAIRRARTLTHQGLKYCRFTTSGFFAGAAANGNTGTGADGVMISWNNDNLIYGISEGYMNFGNQYTWLNVPAAGAQIPVVSTNSNVTRVVQNIGGHRYIPLGTWEALFWIPPLYIAGNTSVDGDWVIGNYTGNQAIPPSAVMIAKHFSSPIGSGATKSRVYFADGTYMQPGLSMAVGTIAENDHAQGTGDWRAVVAAGQTGPAMTAAVPAVAGVANQGAVYNHRSTTDDPRGRVELDGYIAITANIADGAVIGFLPGVNTRSSGQLMPVVSRHAGNNTVPGLSMISFINTTIGGQNGVSVLLYGNSGGNVAAGNGGANGASGVISLAGLFFSHV